MGKDFIKLFPYQVTGSKWLQTRKVALLADECRLGKTIQVINAIDSLNLNRILIICPAVARIHWAREFEKWSALRPPLFVVTQRGQRISCRQSTILSYDLLSYTHFTDGYDFEVIVVDEVHYAKNVAAKRTNGVFGKGGIIHETSRQNKKAKFWCLSATPAPNHAGELWPLLYTFGVTDLKQNDFIQRFCNYVPSVYGNSGGKGMGGQNRWQITGSKKSAIPELRQLLTRVMLRRTVEEVGIQMPKVMHSTIVVEPGEVDLTTSSFANYVFPVDRIAELEAKLKNELAQVTKAVDLKNIRVLEGLAKSVSTIRRYTGAQKVEKVAQLLKEELEVNPSKKIVVFALHVDVIDGLRERLKDYGAVTLYGGTRFEKAHKHIDKFNKNPKCRVFVGNIIAAGLVIDLSVAHDIIFVEQDWVPGNNHQAASRCGGPKQKSKNIFIRYVALANSIDEKVVALLEKKQKELTEIFAKDTQTPTPSQSIESLLD